MGGTQTTARLPNKIQHHGCLTNPFRRPVQAALLALALLHALLGVRSLLLDFGLPLRWHRALFVLALVLAAGLFAGVWAWRWY